MHWSIILRNVISIAVLGILTFSLYALRGYLYRLAATEVRRRKQIR